MKKQWTITFRPTIYLKKQAGQFWTLQLQDFQQATITEDNKKHIINYPEK